jgi:hypothetical protein
MYDKGEKEDLSEFKQTEYWEAVQNFQKFIVAEGRKGFSPERLGERTGLCPDFFLRGCSMPCSQSNSDSGFAPATTSAGLLPHCEQPTRNARP